MSTEIERQRVLESWWKSSARTFSWREEDDPWTVFLSEFLLRRTRADQVQALLPTALKRFPTPRALAKARAETVNRTFATVGLRGRTRQLHTASKEIANRHDGNVPTHSVELENLTGVGPYVAGAVASRTSGEPVVLIDTNTVRVVTRIEGIEPKSSEPRREKQVVDAINAFFGGPTTAENWWAVIDLAHAMCKPYKPVCTECPVASHCRTAGVTEPVPAR